MNNFTTNTYEMKREISNFRVYISILTPAFNWKKC